MRHKSFLNITVTIIILASCDKKNLDQPALASLEESALSNKRGVEALLIGAYSLLDGSNGNPASWGSAASNWIYGSICGSEAYTGSRSDDEVGIRDIESFKHLPTDGYFHDKWNMVYAGVQRANTVLRVMKKAKDLKPEDRTRIEAEALFLRAHYHFEAKKMWNNVPFVDETITYDAANYFLSNERDIWPWIERDLKFAMDSLPDIQLAVGRANKYAAEAFLAKAYLFQRKFAEAHPLLQDLINNGLTAAGEKYRLVNYADNFNPATKNKEEIVFSVQMSVNDNSGGVNGNIGDALNFPWGNGPGLCCGFFQPSQYLVNHFKTDDVTGLPGVDNYSSGAVKNDQGIESGDPFTPDTGTLDPRLDWTVGRRGIPYLDWGDHPGKDWIRDQNFSGPYSPKKNVYYKEQQGRLSDATFSTFWWPGLTANNVNLIRFSDVLLWAAEVEAELGNPESAREYVNQIRRRAADPSGWVKRDDGTPAANYKIGEYVQPWSDKAFALKAIRYERMLELAMEGHRFFDLVRWGIADEEINNYLKKEQNLRRYLEGAEFKKNKNEYFPIPYGEIERSAGPDGIRRLKQNPGY